MSQPKLELEQSARDIEEFIAKWNKMGSIFKCAKPGVIRLDDEKDFRQQIDELNLMYPRISGLLLRYVRSERYEPLTGVHIKDYNPIVDILISTSSLSSIIFNTEPPKLKNHHSIAEFEQKWHTARSLLISLLGSVRLRLEEVGKVRLEEYLRLKNVEATFVRFKPISDFSSFIQSIDFLRLGHTWCLATIALQIQEVATMKIAERLAIKLQWMRPRLDSTDNTRL